VVCITAVFTKPPYPFYGLSAVCFAKLCSKEKSLYRTVLSLSATGEAWLCLTLFVKEEYFTNNLRQGSPKHQK